MLKIVYPYTQPNFGVDVDWFLFNQPKHWPSQSSESPYSFYWLDNSQEIALASIHIWVTHAQAISPLRASFGGFELSGQITAIEIQQFVREILQYLSTLGCSSLKLIQCPTCYQANSNILHQILVELGFQVCYTDHNQHLAVTEKPFYTQLHTSAKRRLNKCRQAGITAQLLKKPFNYEAIYQFIIAARIRKNYPISLTLNDFIQLHQQFSAEFKQCVVYDKQQLIATCTLIVVQQNNILYYFLPADHANYLPFSPSIMLIETLYVYAQEQGYEILDLGISSTQGQINEGLFRFKQNLGAITSSKSTYLYTFKTH